MQRGINTKLLLWTLACVLLFGGAVWAVHTVQMQRNARGLVRQAELAIQQDEFAKAADLLQSYLGYEPNDTDAIALYALTLERASGSDDSRFKTYLLMEQVLRRQPDRQDIRRRAVQAAIDVGRMQDAIRHLEYLLTLAPNDPELEHKLGWCQEANGQYEASAESLRRAIALAPDHIDSYILLGELLGRRLKQPREAQAVMDAMTAANPSSWQAYLARARFYYGKGMIDVAATDFYKAVDLAPQQDEALLAAAEIALLRGNLAEARVHVHRRLQADPKNEFLYRALATLELRSGHVDEAAANLQRGLGELPDSVGLHGQLAEVLLDGGRISEAQSLIKWVEKNGSAPGLAEYLEGRLLMGDGSWPQAIDKLQSARAGKSLPPDWTSNLSVCLGRCYEHLGELDRQVAAYRDAVVLDPGNVDARLQFGKSLLAARFPEEAYLELRHLSALPQAAPETWLLLARALLERFARHAPGVVEWKDLDAALNKAAELNPGNDALPCLAAERLLLMGDSQAALAILQDAVARHPQEVKAWITLANTQASLGHAAEALATLESGQQRLGPVLEILRAQVRFWAQQPGPKARPALAHIAEQATARSRDDKVLLLRDLAVALLSLGEKREAEKALKQIAALLPKDVSCRVLLFDLLLGDNRDAEAAAILVDLAAIEGDDGVLWRAGEVARAIWKAWRGDASQLELARQRLAEIQKRRSDWGRAALLQGYLEEIDGRLDAAMESYRRAIDLGERPPAVVLRVAQRLLVQNLFAEAGQVLRQLEDVMPLHREHARLAAEIALQNDELKRALLLAQRAVPSPSRDYRDQLWLAQVQWLAGQPLQAETTLREAVRTAPHVPDVWVALARHLTRTNQTSQVDDTLQDMENTIPADRADLTRARCLEAAGRTKEAEAQYQNLFAGAADDCVTLRQIAEFYLRQDKPAKVEPVLGRILEPSAHAPLDVAMWARRQLAVVLALRQGPGWPQKALLVLDKNTPPGGPLAEDDRVRAFVLSKVRGSQAEAVHLFEQTLARQPLMPPERFLLAQIYDANGEAAKANRQIRVLLAIHRDEPQYLAYHITSLLTRGEADLAQSLMNTLEQLEPTCVRTRNLREACRKAQGGA